MHRTFMTTITEPLWRNEDDKQPILHGRTQLHSTENDSKIAVSLALNLSDAFDGRQCEKDGRQRMVQVNVGSFVVISEV